MRMTVTPRDRGGHDTDSADRSLMRFEHETLPQRVCFASGEAVSALRAEVERLGATRVMVIAAEAEAELAQRVTAGLPVALRWSEVVMHVPVEVAERARAAATVHEVDCLVSVGGGSTTGLAKTIALTADVPMVDVPTTYAGSEATSVGSDRAGTQDHEGGRASPAPFGGVRRDAERVLAGADECRLGAERAGALRQRDVGPSCRSGRPGAAGEGIHAPATGLPAVMADPAGLPGRERALYGTYPSAVAFSSAGSGCTTRSATPSAAGTTCRTPRPTRWCCRTCWPSTRPAPGAPQAERRIAAAFGARSAIEGLQRLRHDVDAPKALRDYGLKESDVDDGVRAVLEVVPAGNARPVTAGSLQRLLRSAWRGADPSTMTDGMEDG